MDDAVLVRVGRIFTERLAIDVPAADADLFESGVLDSLSFADLLVGLEAEFGIRIPVEAIEIDHFRTLQALGQVVGRAQAAEARPLAQVP